MKSLKKTREELNEIDQGLTKLYEKRLHLMQDVAEYKKKNNLPVLDEKREREVIEKNCDLLEDPSLRPCLTDFFIFIMDQGKNLQKGFLQTNE